MSDDRRYLRDGPTSLPCEQCGEGVFQRTARVKRYCSKRCARLAWHEAHRGSPWTDSRLRTLSCTVTYTNAEGEQWTTVGYGRRWPEAREDADSRVPAKFGEPVSDYVSNVLTIRRSLARVSA